MSVNLAQVRLEPGTVQGIGDGRACADAEPVCEPLPVRVVVGKERRSFREDLVGKLLRPPRVAQARQVFTSRVGLSFPGREQRGETARAPWCARDRSLRRAPPSSSRRASRAAGRRRTDRIEDGAHVVHARLERWKRAAQIGQAGSALVEQDQPEALREPVVETAPVRRLPRVDEVRDVVRDVDEVDVAAAHHLVGDRDAAAPRVPNVERHVPEYS